MPPLPSADAHAPKFHLPQLPNGVSLPALSSALETFERPSIDVSSLNLGKTVGGIATATHLRSRPRRVPWPLAVAALMVLGLTGWVALRRKAARDVMSRTAGNVHEWVSKARLRHAANAPDSARVDPVAFTAARTAVISTQSLDGSRPEGSGYPAGLGANSAGNGPEIGVSRRKKAPRTVEELQHAVPAEAFERGVQA